MQKKKNWKSTDVKFLPQPVKYATALNNLNNYFFDWNGKKEDSLSFVIFDI